MCRKTIKLQLNYNTQEYILLGITREELEILQNPDSFRASVIFDTTMKYFGLNCNLFESDFVILKTLLRNLVKADIDPFNDMYKRKLAILGSVNQPQDIKKALRGAKKCHTIFNRIMNERYKKIKKF